MYTYDIHTTDPGFSLIILLHICIISYIRFSYTTKINNKVIELKIEFYREIIQWIPRLSDVLTQFKLISFRTPTAIKARRFKRTRRPANLLTVNIYIQNLEIYFLVFCPLQIPSPLPKGSHLQIYILRIYLFGDR